MASMKSRKGRNDRIGGLSAIFGTVQEAPSPAWLEQQATEESSTDDETVEKGSVRVPAPKKASIEEFYEAYQDAEAGDVYDDEDDEEELELRDVVVPATEALGVELVDVRSGGGFRALVTAVEEKSVAWEAGVRANDEVIEVGGKAVMEYASSAAVLSAACKAQAVLGHAKLTFFRASGFPPLGNHCNNDNNSSRRSAGDARDTATAGAQLFLEAVSLGREEDGNSQQGNSLQRLGTTGSSLGNGSGGYGDEDAPAGAKGASGGLRRGSLADEGWFALELFDQLEWPATGGSSGLFLDVSGARRRRGAPLIVWSGGEFSTERGHLFFPDNQLWRQDPVTGGLSSKLNGLVADVAGESASPGRKLITWTPTGKANQIFRVQKVAMLPDPAPSNSTAANGTPNPISVVQVASELPSSANLLVLGVAINKQKKGQLPGRYGEQGDSDARPPQKQLPRRSWMGFGPPVVSPMANSSSNGDDSAPAPPPVNPGSRVVTVDGGLADMGGAGGALTAWRVHPHMA